MTKLLIPLLAIVAILTFFKPKNDVQPTLQVDSVTYETIASDGDVHNLLQRLDSAEQQSSTQFVKFRNTRFGVEAPRSSGGCTGSYQQAQPMQQAQPARSSGGCTGSYQQSQPARASQPVRGGGCTGSYSQPMQVQMQVQVPVQVQVPMQVQYSQPVQSGGCTGSYQQSAPRFSQQPVATTRVKVQPFKTVSRPVKSGGCTGSYSMQDVQVPVRGPIRKVLANMSARRTSDNIVSPVQSYAPMQVATTDCVSCQPANDGAIVSPYSTSQSNCGCGDPNCVCVNCQCPNCPGALQRTAQAVGNAVGRAIDAVTPNRPAMICTPTGCVPVEQAAPVPPVEQAAPAPQAPPAQ